MTLLSSKDGLRAREAVANDSLAPLASSLAADLSRVMERPLYIPDRKALLSRDGGRCPRDGTMLDFDPFSPHAHRCPRCGENYTGELHDAFWIYWYQLWLAERAVHAALLSRLGVVPAAGDLAARILDGYSDLYLRYPNVDNALGPTRPFFSTYLESIWLLQLCIASRFMDRTTHSRTLSRFEASVVEPSLALIEQFDEGASNRQVWNNAAIMAANLVLGRRDRAENVLWAESGVAFHLGSSLLEDGTWYEGENYHLFAHRGLWYAVELAESAGFELPPNLLARYERGFVTPFLTSLPDLTFPSRRDSQYAISLRQWRFAEWCELGLARTEDRVLQGMLSRMYTDDAPARDVGRWKSTAEAERNLPPARLTRADLGWKSLLFAREKVDLRAGRPLRSVLLDAQGIAVLRREQGQVYAALDYGVSGGGHGHPDRLNLLLMNGEQRILDDMGTGSYVDPSLHWYRSSLAHNAPFIDRKSQPRVDGTLVAFEDRGAAGWISAMAPLARGCLVTRTVVAMPEYLLDEVKWSAPEARCLDLPLHADLLPRNRQPTSDESLRGSSNLEDGFRFLGESSLVARVAANETLAFTGPRADVWIGSDVPLEVWRATGPGAPGSGEAAFIFLRAAAASGLIRTVWSWKQGVRDAALVPSILIDTRSERHEHVRADHGWTVSIHVGEAKSTIDLLGTRPTEEVYSSVGQQMVEAIPFPHRPFTHAFKNGEFMQGTLGKDHYLRSEQSWLDAGSPTADVEVRNHNGALRIIADVHAERSFVPPGSVNRLDNEHADINGAGLQLYLRGEDVTAGYVIVPISGTASLSIRPIEGWGDDIPVSGSWHETSDGYHVELRVNPPTSYLGFNLLINEKPKGRKRRRGQLMLVLVRPAGTDWVYLRGDRPPHDQMIELRLERD